MNVQRNVSFWSGIGDPSPTYGTERPSTIQPSPSPLFSSSPCFIFLGGKSKPSVSRTHGLFCSDSSFFACGRPPQRFSFHFLDMTLLPPATGARTRKPPCVGKVKPELNIQMQVTVPGSPASSAHVSAYVGSFQYLLSLSLAPSPPCTHFTFLPASSVTDGASRSDYVNPCSWDRVATTAQAYQSTRQRVVDE